MAGLCRGDLRLAMYATTQDIITAYGEDALIAAMDDDAVVHEPTVTAALEKATAEIDSYIADRYPLPLPSTPARLRDICVDIATYKFSQTADVLTDEIRQRYEDAVKWLDKVASGRVSLGLPKAAGQKSAKAVVVSGPKPLFSRQSLKGL